MEHALGFETGFESRIFQALSLHDRVQKAQNHIKTPITLMEQCIHSKIKPSGFALGCSVDTQPLAGKS
jgi:hypothetical protein